MRKEEKKALKGGFLSLLSRSVPLEKEGVWDIFSGLISTPYIINNLLSLLVYYIYSNIVYSSTIGRGERRAYTAIGCWVVFDGRDGTAGQP
jgi:hypothetical protein